MGKRKSSVPTDFAGREQTNLKQFLLKLFEDGYPAEDALHALRNRFDADDFAKARAVGTKSDAAYAKDIRGPRGKN